MVATREVNAGGGGAVVVDGAEAVGSDVVGRVVAPLPVDDRSGAHVAAVARRQTATTSEGRTSPSVRR
jgi:hypothetical protein